MIPSLLSVLLPFHQVEFLLPLAVGDAKQSLNALRHSRAGTVHHLSGGQLGHGVVQLRLRAGVLHAHQLQIPVGRLAHGQNQRLLHALDVIEGQLPAEVVVHHRVRELGPAVDQIPPDDARAVGLAGAEHLDEELLGLGLRNLAGQREVVQIVRNCAEQLAHLIGHELDAIIEVARLAQLHAGGVSHPVVVVLPGPELVRGD